MVKKNTHCGQHFFPLFFLGNLLKPSLDGLWHGFEIFENLELKIPGFFVLLITSTSSSSELRKDFLDRKKVLKSLEANSLIYRGNAVLPARDDVHRAPNVRLANEQKQNHQILHDFCHFSSTLARNWARRGTQKSQMTEILQRKLSLGPY